MKMKMSGQTHKQIKFVQKWIKIANYIALKNMKMKMNGQTHIQISQL